MRPATRSVPAAGPVVPAGPAGDAAGALAGAAAAAAAAAAGATEPPAPPESRTSSEGELLALLRGQGRQRPPADRPGCAGLREWIEDELAGWSGDRYAPARIGWWSLPLGDDVRSPWAVQVASTGRPGTDARPGAAEQVTGVPGAPGPGAGVPAAGGPAGGVAARLLDGLVRVLFRQWVTCRRLSDPLGDALAGLRVSGDPAGLAMAVDRLPAGERRAVAAELAEHARRLVGSWPPVDPRWAPRTGERWTVPVAGGRAVLIGRPDLVIGWPARQRASVGLVAVTAGAMGTVPWRRLWFAALVETLRSGAAPFQVSVFSSGSGTLAARRVELADLSAVAAGVVAAIRSAGRDEPVGAPAASPGASGPIAVRPGQHARRRRPDVGRFPDGAAELPGGLDGRGGSGSVARPCAVLPSGTLGAVTPPVAS